MQDTYRTLGGCDSAELEEKRSRFLARCAPVQSEEAALDFIAATRAEHKTARHHVYAYVLRENNICRYSDDGEPQGTAGLPVLDVLRRGGITDAVLVVTRYFGGTLLGTGGLVHAYGESASMAVNAAGIVTMERRTVYMLECPYSLYDRMARLLESLEASVVRCSFGIAVSMEVAVQSARAAELLAQVSELTRGGAEPVYICDRYERITSGDCD